MALKYKQKPILIEAIRLTWENWPAICDFVPKPHFIAGCFIDKNGNAVPEDQPQDGTNRIGFKLATDRGVALAREGDYIIKGIHGEFYPCEPDVFRETYELAEPTTEET